MQPVLQWLASPKEEKLDGRSIPRRLSWKNEKKKKVYYERKWKSVWVTTFWERGTSYIDNLSQGSWSFDENIAE